MKQFSKAYAQSVTKQEFAKQHAHLKDEFNLGEVWESLQEPKKDPEKVVEKG